MGKINLFLPTLLYETGNINREVCGKRMIKKINFNLFRSNELLSKLHKKVIICFENKWKKGMSLTPKY